MDNPVMAVTCMATPSLISIEALWAATEAFALSGQIDRTENINSSRVWLFTGKEDLVVNSGTPSASPTHICVQCTKRLTGVCVCMSLQR
jgi:hypothetical protein